MAGWATPWTRQYGLALGIVSALLLLSTACAGAPAASKPAGGAAPASGASTAQAPPANPVTYTGGDRQQRLEAGARQEGTVTWYTSLTIHIAEALARAFEARYPGVKVELFRAADNEILTKVSEESRAGRNIADLLEIPSPALKVMKDAGLLAEYYLPNADAFPADGKEMGTGGNVWWVVDREHYISFGYNTTLLSAADVPKDWNGLLAPALRNQMAIAGTSTGVNFVGSLKAHQPPDYLPRLGQQGMKVQMISGTALLDLIAKGEVAASPTVFQAEVLIAKTKGAPVDWAALPPVTANAGAIALVNKAPHPQAAVLLAEFILGPEGQKLLKDNYFGLAGDNPGFARWYPDQNMNAAQYEQSFEDWKKLMTETFVR